MRKIFALSKILDLYRQVSVLVGVLLAMSALCLMASVVAFWLIGEGTISTSLWGLALAASLVGLVILHLAYPRLRGALVTAEKERNAILASAHRDDLTGVLTRSYFIDTLRNYLHHGSDVPVGYMLVDLDYLKAMNDSNGHAAGDAALAHLTDTIHALAPDAMIGRLGGDEFGVAFIGHDSRPALRRLAEHLLAEFGRPVEIVGRQMRLSATIGVAVAPHDGESFDEIMFKADLALYHGKRNGRRQAVAFDDEMLSEERHKRFVERELRAAILLNELDLHYQPIYAADGLKQLACEALVRWKHSVRGTIAPGEFVHVAEQSDLIDKLGEWVLRRACLDLPALGVARVNINVSAVQLRRPEFVDRFAEILNETGTLGGRIVVEITETVALLAGGVEMTNLAALRQMGVRVAIDDFGAGHTSLQYLRGFAFDVIKIDKAYVHNIATDRVDALIVRSICEVARTIGAAVVAEGVETHEQMRALQDAGATALQGFLLGRPEPLRGPERTLASVA